MDKKIIIFLVAGLAIGLIIGSFFPLSLDLLGAKAKIGEKVKSLYELANPGSTFSIISINEESGIYKVVLRADTPFGTTYREAYVTKDGELLTEGVIFVSKSMEQIAAYKDFVDCLDSKGVKIYGISNQTATLLQLNTLGRYSTKIFVSCDDPKPCQDAGVTQVPSVVYKGEIFPGVQSISWFETKTGCKLKTV
jgi:hypothetical protein